MTLTRWKVTAGALGLSLGGLAALADGPTKPAPHAIPACPVILPAPIAVAAPTLPALGVGGLALPAATVPVEIAPALPSPMAMPVAAAPIPSKPAPVKPEPVLAAAPDAPAAEPAAVHRAADPAPAATDKKLRVLLNMGDDRPRFEVRDGDEVLLKVVCDRVDVKSPSEKGEAMSVLKAVGGVGFLAPGGDGTCDELTLAPGTGLVVVAGKVKYKYHWGRVESEMLADRMTFRVGATVAPGAGPTAVPASYQRR